MHKTNTLTLYLGYDKERELSLNACIFRAAQKLGLVRADETGFGWSTDEIAELGDKIRLRVREDPTALNDVRKEVRVKLAADLELFPARLPVCREQETGAPGS